MIVHPAPAPRQEAPRRPILILASPLGWLLILGWKPLAILAVLFVVGVVLLTQVAAPMARQANRQAEATVTAYLQSGPRVAP